jgi:hypothetical protein
MDLLCADLANSMKLPDSLCLMHRLVFASVHKIGQQALFFQRSSFYALFETAVQPYADSSIIQATLSDF